MLSVGAVATVVDRHVFYNNSVYDGRRAEADSGDDAAIAPDKAALLPGERISAANYTNYSRGVNGIMIDVAGLPEGGTIGADDFQFNVGNDSDPSGWDLAPAPSAVVVRRLADPEPVSRVTVTWSARAISNAWLRVSLAANANTGLAAPDVFFFGNLMGDDTSREEGARATVDRLDVAFARLTLTRPATLDGTYDFDRDGRVGRSDIWVARSNLGAGLHTSAPFPAGATSVPEPVPPVPGEWHSIFRDEFTDDDLDPVWHTSQYWEQTVTVVGDGELQAYDVSGVSVGDGMLRLTAREDDRYGVPYVSGLVMTGGNDTDRDEPRFSFLYGYMEVRAKLPPGHGMWPAVWMMPASYDDDNGEIDVLEVVGRDPTEANFALHRHGEDDVEDWDGPDFSQDFHTFGVDWQADYVAWYVDGVERARITDRSLICPEAMYPILNLAIGGDWGGPPDATTQFPATMLVDYVRVWQAGGAAAFDP